MADHDVLLERVRKLLAKAEAQGVTPQEAEALTAKAAELMARYGIDRALLAATQPQSDTPADRLIEVDNPWAQVKAHLLTGVATALRCQCVLVPRPGPGTRVHVFGYGSDLERADILYTSLLVQMARALAAALPARMSGERAWRRSWMLGYIAAVTARVRRAEDTAVRTADEQAHAGGGMSAALVVADRSVTVRRQVETAYPRTRKTRLSYSGSGYGAGYREGQRADIGGSKLRGGRARQLGGGR